MRGARIAVVLIVAVGFATYALLGSTVDSPHVFSDELLYFDTAAAVTDGDGLSVRGQDYRYAPLYPLLLSPLHWIASNRVAAYELAKALNALLFSLTAIPVFLVARRVLPPWPSAAVAGLSISIPSAVYVSVVMTESLAYLACWWTFYAIVLALERPTVSRQCVVLLAIVLAASVRTQFVLLAVVYALGLVVVALIVPARRMRPTEIATTLWPTLIGFALAAGTATVALGGTSVASGAIGVYSVLWRSYDLQEVARWFVYHLANLELYMAVVPVVIAPVVLTSLFTRARRGDERHAACLAIFVVASAVFLLLAAAFNSTPYAVGSLHDRVLFYVVPFWLLCLVFWLSDGAPRPTISLTCGVAAAVILPLLLPFSEYARDESRQQFNGVGTTLWAALNEAVGSGTAGRLSMLGFVAALVALALLARVRARLLPMAVLACFVFSAALNWDVARRVATPWAAVLPADERSWLDDRLPVGRTATALISVEGCRALAARDGFYLTEFFNGSLNRVAHVGTPPDELPAYSASIGEMGSVSVAGAPLVADYVVTHSGVRVEGRRIGSGTAGGLVLWYVGGPVHVPDFDSADKVLRAACRAATG